MPKTITQTKVVTYQVKDDADVFATAFIGEEQEGAWTMLLGQEHLGGDMEPKKIRIGKGKDLAEGIPSLEVSAVVKDVRPATDRLTLTVEVTGGPAKRSYEISNVGEPGDNAAYSIFVSFI